MNDTSLNRRRFLAAGSATVAGSLVAGSGTAAAGTSGSVVRPTADHRILVAKKPGVMDPEANAVQRLIARRGLGERPVASFRVYEVAGTPSAEPLAPWPCQKECV